MTQVLVKDKMMTDNPVLKCLMKFANLLGDLSKKVGHCFRKVLGAQKNKVVFEQ